MTPITVQETTHGRMKNSLSMGGGSPGAKYIVNESGRRAQNDYEENAGGLRPQGGRMRPPPTRALQGLRCQALQNVFAQFLRFAEKFLVFEEDAIELQRLVSVELATKHHVAHVDGIRQSRVFGQLFKGG